MIAGDEVWMEYDVDPPLLHARLLLLERAWDPWLGGVQCRQLAIGV